MNTQVSKTQESVFKGFLRLVGSLSLLALVFVAAPYTWMDSIHQMLGMGVLPEQPVVGYLARSASAFYAILGGLLWIVSFNLSRHRYVLNYLGVSFILFGVSLCLIDYIEQLPFFWIIIEGPTVILFGALLLGLNHACTTQSPSLSAGESQG